MMCKIRLILLLLSICLLINGKKLFVDDLALSNHKARMFLGSASDNDASYNDEYAFDIQTNCVPCKFNINPCCAPNLCIKKFFWNECMKIRTSKP